MEVIGHGAQAIIYKTQPQDKPVVLKQRLPKKYRHPDLDRKINQSRVKTQAKIMKKLNSTLIGSVHVPRVLKVDNQNYMIEMEYIQGPKLKDFLNQEGLAEEKANWMECIIHGDLTTSNMILSQEDTIFLIDFGLSYFREAAQDRAVDLYVLERAFKSTHPQLEDKFTEVLIAYGEEAALKRLEVVRQRGRKKIAFG